MYLQHRKQRGFTLIEVMIASVVALMFIAAVITGLVALMRKIESGKLEQQEAQELVQLATAFKTYNPNNKLGWALGSRTETQITTLITAGHLPASFGARHGSTSGRTPYGNTYRIFSVVDATKANILRTIITESGSASVSMLDRAGVPNSNAEIGSLKERIAQKVTETSKLYTATVPASSTTAAGAIGSFTQVLTTHLGSNAFQPIVVVFVGWPEYDPTGGGGGGTPTVMSVGTCSVYEAGSYVNSSGNLAYRNGQCPAGQTTVKMLPRCASSGQISAVPEIGAAVTFGTVTRQSYPNDLDLGDLSNCKGENGAPYWQDYCDQLYQSLISAPNEVTNGIITINNVVIEETACGSVSYDYSGSYWGRPTPLGGHRWNFPQGYQDALCCTPP